MQRNHALVVGGVVLLSMTACAGGVGLGSRTTTSAPATTTAPTTTTGPAAATATLDSPTSSTPSPTSSSAPTDWAAIVADVQPAVVRLEVASCDSRWMGTGFVVGPHQIMTAAHVAIDAQTISVQGDGFNTTADVVGLDRGSDSAMLWSPEELEHPLELAPVSPQLAAPVALLGFPQAVSDLRVTQGIVSGLEASADYPDVDIHLDRLIATDAAINGGNSGGPAMGRDGSVIGLVTGKQLWNVDADPVEGTGFLVPASQLAPHLREWRELTPPDGGRGCDGDTEAPEGDDAVLDVTVVPDSPEAGEVARSLVVHGESINHGDYEIAWELFTPKMKRDLGSLSKWESGLASSYWTDLTVGSVEVSGDAAIVEVALRTEQDARDGYKGQDCSIYSLTYSMERQGAGWLIDHASNAAGSPRACPG
ncbi:MAG: S1C family serine protease [Pedococcus sp.]